MVRNLAVIDTTGINQGSWGVDKIILTEKIRNQQKIYTLSFSNENTADILELEFTPMKLRAFIKLLTEKPIEDYDDTIVLGVLK